MRHSIEKKLRIIIIYLSNNLSLTNKRFDLLKELCTREDIIISKRSLITIVNRWNKTGKRIS